MTEMTKYRATKIMRELYLAKGCCRMYDEERRESESSQKYKKGFEVRFVCAPGESKALIEALKVLGLRPGRKYKKVKQVVFPVYGREQVEKIIALVNR